MGPSDFQCASRLSGEPLWPRSHLHHPLFNNLLMRSVCLSLTQEPGCVCTVLLSPGKQTPSLSQSRNNELGFKITALQTPHSKGMLCATGFWLSEPRGFMFSSFFPCNRGSWKLLVLVKSPMRLWQHPKALGAAAS